jgi:glycosyltransferase involved in cell wall biosynthesis
MKRVCLVSLCASHYRKLIYSLMDEQMNSDFIFGKGETTVKTFDISLLRNAKEVPLLPIGSGRWYKMKNVIKLTKGYDVIIDDMGILCTTSWYLAIVALFRGQKVLLWSHGWYGREGFVKKWMKRAYSALTKGMFVYGNYAHDLMIENGFEPQKLHVIHNSLDYDSQLKLRKKMMFSGIYKEHFGNDAPVLLMIGRLNLRKHLDLLILAIDSLKKNGNIFNVILIGTGEDEATLKSMVDERNLESQVWFYGACYDEKTNAELIYNADVCVVPGDIGLTAIHSMMFGCPCISHDYFPNQGPEFEAIRPGITGDFYKHGSVEGLADCILNWFTSHCANREDVRMDCFKEVDENWNPHKQIKILKNVINEYECS